MGKLAILKRLSKILPKRTLEIIFKTSILPCIEYAVTVWGTCTAKGINMAQRLQNAAARIISRNFDYVNVRGEDLVRTLKWPTILEKRRFHTATLMFKCIHGLAPNYLCDQVNLLREINFYNTRKTGEMKVEVPFPKNEIFKGSLQYDGAMVWNSLPEFLKKCHSITDFKDMYKRFYFR